MLGCHLGLGLANSSGRVPVSVPLQLSSFCDQLGSLLCVLSPAEGQEVFAEGQNVGSLGPARCICFILKAC